MLDDKICLKEKTFYGIDFGLFLSEIVLMSLSKSDNGVDKFCRRFVGVRSYGRI